MADTFLKKIRNCLEDIKVIFTILVFFMGATGLGAKEYMKKSDQLESATHAVKTMSGLIHENKEKITTVHKTTVIRDCAECTAIKRSFSDHLRKFH